MSMWQFGRGSEHVEDERAPSTFSGSSVLWHPLLPLRARPVLPHTVASVIVRQSSTSSTATDEDSSSSSSSSSKASNSKKTPAANVDESPPSNNTKTQQQHALDGAPPATLVVDGTVMQALRRLITASKPGKGGSPHLPPTVILCLARPTKRAPNRPLELDSMYPMGVSATLQLVGENGDLPSGAGAGPDDLLEIRLTARGRVALTGLRYDPSLQLPLVRVAEVPDEPFDTEDRLVRAMVLTLQERMEVLRSLGHPLAKSAGAMKALETAFANGDPSACADLAASCTTVGAESLQLTVLQQVDVPQKLRRVVALLQREIEVFKLMMKNIEVLNGRGKSSNEGDSSSQSPLASALGSILRGKAQGPAGNPAGGAGNDRNAKMMQEINEKLSRPGLRVPAHASAIIAEEMERMSALDPQMNASEHYNCRNYLTWLVGLPWGLYTQDSFDVSKAAFVLNEDHFGIEDVKDRILEFIAVSSLAAAQAHMQMARLPPPAPPSPTPVSQKLVEKTDSVSTPAASLPQESENRLTEAASLGKGKILCLVGPPGVGKTSVGASIARALGRKFIRFSCGGVHDTAEMKGHRRTYVGAMPGKIIQALRRCGTANPVMLIDEIDKLGRHARDGDPAASLLEAFDPEQNHEFMDLYLDVAFDLSKVLFVCTANSLDNIPRPLLDRMEVIEMSGYFLDEKLNIAQRYLLPKLRSETGLVALDQKQSDSLGVVDVREDALIELIQNYCREAGVRSLQKHLERLFRKAAVQVVESREKAAGTTPTLTVTAQNLTDFVGQPRFTSDSLYDSSSPAPPGCVQGLAWNQVGGSVLWIETVVVSRSDRGSRDDDDTSERSRRGAVNSASPGRLQTTGKLGEVIRESVHIAYSFARVFGGEATCDFFETATLHTHFPEGATPKDGPSAGVTIVTSLLSLALDIPVPADTAMTGEISLTGKVLPVGGIKEKVMAARRSGVHRVFLPELNRVDWEELDAKLRDGLEVHFSTSYEEIFRKLFPKLLSHKPFHFGGNIALPSKL